MFTTVNQEIQKEMEEMLFGAKSPEDVMEALLIFGTYSIEPTLALRYLGELRKFITQDHRKDDGVQEAFTHLTNTLRSEILELRRIKAMNQVKPYDPEDHLYVENVSDEWNWRIMLEEAETVGEVIALVLQVVSNVKPRIALIRLNEASKKIKSELLEDPILVNFFLESIKLIRADG